MRAQQGIRELARDKSDANNNKMTQGTGEMLAPENHHGNEHDNEALKASECTSTTGSASGSGSLTPMEGSLATEHTTPVSPDNSSTSPSSVLSGDEEDDTSKSSSSSSSSQQPGRSESDHSKLLRRTVPIYMISSASEKKTSPRHHTNNGIVDKQYVVRMVSADVRTDASGSNYTAYIMSVEVMEHPSGGEATKEVTQKEAAVPAGGLLLKDIVEHRYSEFAKLHAELEANLVSMACPFPSKQRLLFKKACFWKQDDRHGLQEEMLIHQRKTQLDAWLMELCEWLNRGDLRGTLYDSVLEFFTVSAALPCDRANPISFDEWRRETEQQQQQQHDNKIMEPSVSPETDSTTDDSPNNTESNEEDYIFDEEEDTFDNGDDDDDDLGFVMGDLPDADDHAVGSEKHLSKPVTFTLGSSIRQAAYTVMHMCCPPTHTNLYDQKHDISIPLDLLRNAKGLCFLTVVKAGFVISGRVGTGLVIARRPDGSWSPPTAIGTVGVGWGALIGGDITDYLLVLNTDGAVRSFGGTGTSGTVNLGAELGVAMGPVGRSATGNVQASDEGVHPVYAYAHSKGLFVGMSFEGSVVTSRPDVNAKFYGRPLEPAHILFDATVPQPRAAEPLYEALDLAMGIEIPVDGIRPSQLLTKKQLAAAAGDVSRRVSESIRNKYREHQQLRSQIIQNNTTTQTSSPVPTIPASELAEPESS